MITIFILCMFFLFIYVCIYIMDYLLNIYTKNIKNKWLEILTKIYIQSNLIAYKKNNCRNLSNLFITYKKLLSYF